VPFRCAKSPVLLVLAGLAERARRLIAIAHPNFREELDRAAHAIRQRGF